MRAGTSLFLVAMTCFAGVNASSGEPDERNAKELQLLEGIWASDQPKSDGRRDVFQFNDGKLGWQSTRYREGQPLIGHSKVFEIRLNVNAKPKEITLIRGEKDDKETRLGIYEIEGDTLKITFGWEKDRPKKLDEKGAQVLVLKKGKTNEK